jgi:hypothetical protein
MTIHTINSKCFELCNEQHTKIGVLTYEDIDFTNATIETDLNYTILFFAIGTWITALSEQKIATIKVVPGGLITILTYKKKKKYMFKKSTNWRTRFLLTNQHGDEILTLIPTINWEKQSHDFIIQLNDEFEKECDSLLILQALHCANCSLSMMIGGQVPALVSL